MTDIKDIAKSLQTNTADQGQKLVKTDQNVEEVKDNAEEAHKEIEEAQGHQTSGAKWMCYILGVVLGVAVILTIIIVVSKK